MSEFREDRSARAVTMALALFGFFLFAARNLEATPNFMRKLRNPSDGCHACHTIMPRLNEFGFKFRAAGYRVPSQIGEGDEKPFELGDYFSAGIIATYTASKTEIGPVSSHNNQLGFSSIDSFPLTGSIGGNYASKVEIDFGPKGDLNLNAAYVRYSRGDQDRFFTARLGILPAEGYGAQDRAIGLSSALFAGTAANYNQNQFFTTGIKSAALELGYDYKHTSIRASILEGAILVNENGTLKVYGAHKEELSPSLPARSPLPRRISSSRPPRFSPAMEAAFPFSTTTGKWASPT